MKNLTYVIKELKVDNDNPDTGVYAVSFTDNPAVETKFMYFGENLLPFFKYTAEPEDELIDNSHDFCKLHAGKVFHITEINKWGNISKEEKGMYKFVEESNFFESFDGTGNSNIDEQLYNCRHWLKRVSSIEDVPTNKRHLLNLNKETYIELKVDDEEQRIVKGLVLRSGQMIYRNDADGKGNPGYIYFSKSTVKHLKERYGYSKNVTFRHREDITGTCIMMDSQIEEDEKEVRWLITYKVVSDKLWNIIKAQGVIGFSIEAIMGF